MAYRLHAIPLVRRLMALAGVALVFASLLAGCDLPGGDSTTTSVNPTVTPVPLRLDLYTHLTSIVMRAPDDGWIVGYQVAGVASHPVLFHYNGVWRPFPLPAVHMYPLTMAMVSATEGWIGGGVDGDEASSGVLLHVANGQWTTAQLPAGTGRIMNLAMVSPDEGWAVAASTAHVNSEILHYSQGAWSVQYSVPDASELGSVSMDSATDGWAAGIGLGHGALWHYSGGTWTRVLLNDPQHADLQYVSMLSATEGWGIGSLPLPIQPGDQFSPQGGAVWQYANGQWRVVERDTSDPVRNTHLYALDAVSMTDVWAGGQSGENSFLHLTNGVWRLVKEPAVNVGVNAFAMTSATSGWAVADGGQIMRYRNGSWTISPVSAPLPS